MRKLLTTLAVAMDFAAGALAGTLILLSETGEVYYLVWTDGNLVATRVE